MSMICAPGSRHSRPRLSLAIKQTRQAGDWQQFQVSVRLTASALVAAVGDGRQFRSSRHFAAWLRLTPRMASSGDKQRIGHISKGGDRYLRTLLIHGARAVVGAVNRPNLRPRSWLTPLLARRPIPVAATALAHKTARIVWAMLVRGETYRVRVTAMA